MKKAKFKSLLSIIILILIWSNTIGQSYPILEVKKDSTATILRSDLILLLNEADKITLLNARIGLADNYINLLEKSQSVKDSALKQGNILIKDYSDKLNQCNDYNQKLIYSLNTDLTKVKKKSIIKNYAIIGLGLGLFAMIILK